MAIVSIVDRSQLEDTLRLDAEYYQPDYLELVHSLRQLAAVPLESVCYFVRKGIFDLSPTYYQDTGVPFVRTTEIRSEIADLSSVVFIADDTHRSHTSTQLASGDIVFTKIGANIGDSAILPRSYETYNFSQNVAGAKVRKYMISPYYLAAYLSSRYGRAQLIRAQMPSGQGKLELVGIKRVLIFEADSKLQEHVTNIYIGAEDKIQQAFGLYSEAESLLLEELGLNGFKPKYELSYTSNLSKAFGAHRIDAEYFQPAYDQLIGKISSYENGYTRLATYAEPVRPDFDPGRHPNTYFKYVELADIEASIGVIRGASQVKGDEAPSRARRILKKGHVIASSVEGSLEKVALVDEEYEASLASTGFFQFRAREIQPEVLLVLARSMVLQVQLKRQCAGTILTAVPNESLKRIIIPILPPGVRQEIAKLIRRSHDARRKAVELLEQAKRKVEEAIDEAASR